MGICVKLQTFSGTYAPVVQMVCHPGFSDGLSSILTTGKSGAARETFIKYE